MFKIPDVDHKRYCAHGIHTNCFDINGITKESSFQTFQQFFCRLCFYCLNKQFQNLYPLEMTKDKLYELFEFLKIFRFDITYHQFDALSLYYFPPSVPSDTLKKFEEGLKETYPRQAIISIIDQWLERTTRELCDIRNYTNEAYEEKNGVALPPPLNVFQAIPVIYTHSIHPMFDLFVFLQKLKFQLSECKIEKEQFLRDRLDELSKLELFKQKNVEKTVQVLCDIKQSWANFVGELTDENPNGVFECNCFKTLQDIVIVSLRRMGVDRFFPYVEINRQLRVFQRDSLQHKPVYHHPDGPIWFNPRETVCCENH
jgi:hypothetical protein